MYLIYRETRRCAECGCVFDADLSRDGELMCFKDTKSTELRWLPILGKGGFDELRKRLATAEKRVAIGEHTRPYETFEAVFDLIQERPESGGFFRVRWELYCHQCQSKGLVAIGARVFTKPRLKWMRYDLSRLESELQETDDG